MGKSEYSVENASISDVSSPSIQEKNDLKRDLKDRHISLIALAGIIGPGILVGVSFALANGPASLLIGFGIIGLVGLIMMQSLGELATTYPTGGCFSTLGNKFVDPAWGATVGWYYVIIWVTVLSNEFNMIASIMQYWGPQVPLYGYVLIFWFVFSLFQLLGVGAFGEAEFWLALVKIVGIIAFYIFSVVYVSGGIKGHKAFGFQYWNNPGAFNGGFKGVINTFVYASTYYAGMEMIAISATEARNPAKAIPKAIRQTVVRIIVIFMGIAFFYGLTVPYNDPALSSGTKALKSPMTIAIAHAGWEGGAHLVNAFVLVTVISAANSAIYVGSRTIVNLAKEGAAPKILKWTDKRGVPIPAIALMGTSGLLSLMNVNTGAAAAYDYIVSLSGVSVFVVWGNVCFYHMRFRRAMRLQNRSIDELTYKGWLYPIFPILGIALNIILALIQGWSFFKPFKAGSFVDAYILLPLFFVIFGIVKVFKKTKWVDLSTVDLDEGRREEIVCSLDISK